MDYGANHSFLLCRAPAPGVGMAMVLEAPRGATALVLGRLAPVFLPDGRRLYLADGVNGFSPYLFSREARRRGLGDEVLDRVFLTRAFTIHQLAAVAAEMLRPLLMQRPQPAIAILGLDHLFLEESLRAAERARVLGAIMADLEALRREGARLLITYERPAEAERWWRPMLDFGDVRGRALKGPDGEWNLHMEGTDNGKNAADIQHLAAGGDRVVEGLSSGTEG